MTLLGKYSIDYDNPDSGTKILEPHYDGFLVGIAHLTNPVFDENFMYLETQFRDTPPPPPQPPLPPPDGNPYAAIPFPVEYLRTDLTGNRTDRKGLRTDRKGIDDYANAYHIFYWVLQLYLI
jgi:hypothetical protein